MSSIPRAGRVGFLAAACLLAGCSATSVGGGVAAGDEALHATIGAEGGELVGAKGSRVEGVHLVIPRGALTAATEVSVKLSDDASPLPGTATRCGQTFAIEPAGLALALPAALTVPFDEAVVSKSERLDEEVKVWVRSGDQWGQTLQTDSREGSVTIDLDTLTNVAPGINPPAKDDLVRFRLYPNPRLVRCLAQYPDDPKRRPAADVVVVRGDVNDSLRLDARNIRPGLALHLFTVEGSPLKSDGTPDPAFTSFGMARYQSDVEASQAGRAHIQIRTALLHPAPPTSTFHVGLWLNDPKDAAACGFEVKPAIPLNGDHEAGPLAMISAPDATSNLGPLCTKADTSVSPARCTP